MTESQTGTTQPVRVRIAPSPTGDPHVGTGYIALFNYVFARANQGRFVLRIEDTDRERSNTESERQIFHSLRWLGLDWDEGPDIGGPYGPYRQSERSDIYKEHAKLLVEKGAAYYCFCTPERLAALRAEQREKKLQFGYDGACRELPAGKIREKLAAGTPHVIRLAVPRTGQTRVHDLVRNEVVFENAGIDDQVLQKSDGFPTYHLANVVDDHLMEITHVVRAEEWISSTPKHLLLYEAFGWEPPVFVHMPLLRNTDKSKISKRKNPTSLLWYEEEGFLPEALRNFLALMGWSFEDEREVFSLEEMISAFTWYRVATGAPVFDMQKLEWLNGLYIRDMDGPELVQRVREVVPATCDLDSAFMEQTMPIVQERMKRLTDYMTVAGFLFADEVTPPIEDLIPKKTTRESAQLILAEAHAAFSDAEDWHTEALETRCRSLIERLGLKPRSVFMCIRVAVTGSSVSPPLFESMELLGRERSLARIAAARDRIEAE